MQALLPFRKDRYDLSAIEAAIREFYPLNIDVPIGQHPTTQSRWKYIQESTEAGSDTMEKWKDALVKWKGSWDHDVINSTQFQLREPSLNAYIALKNAEFDIYAAKQEIHFAISLMGPFYTVYGLDRIVISDANSKFHRNIRTVISPDYYFKPVFEQLMEKLESTFQKYRFVPYQVFDVDVKGLKTREHQAKDSKVFHALFHEKFDFSTKVMGDQALFGHDQWYCENPNLKDDWVIRPPLSYLNRQRRDSNQGISDES